MTAWASAEIDKIAVALAKAQAIMPAPVNDKTGSAGKMGTIKYQYASLASIRDALIPALTAQEIAVVQPIGVMDDTNAVVVHTKLVHSSGQWLASDVPVYRLTTASGDPSAFYVAPQAMGSAITYARRYALLALCCQVGEDADDDGERASEEARKEAARKPQALPPNPMKTAATPQTSQTAAGPPGVSHGSGRASALAEDGLRAEQAEIELVLRSAADRGSENLEAIWQSLPGIHRRHFKTLLDRHLKPIALQVDADRQADEAAEPEEVEQ